MQLGLPLGSLVTGLPVRVRAELVWFTELRLALDVGGTEAGSFLLHLRLGVLEVGRTSGSDDLADAKLAFSNKTALVDYLSGRPLEELERAGAVDVDGDAAARFAGYFDDPADMTRIRVTLHGPVPR